MVSVLPLMVQMPEDALAIEKVTGKPLLALALTLMGVLLKEVVGIAVNATVWLPWVTLNDCALEAAA
jgi:hypothetical protein